MLGPLMIDLLGIELTNEERDLLQHPLVGGVILFTRNYQSIKQLTELVAAIKAVRDPALLVGVDHEGGVVQRFHADFTELPPMQDFGKWYEQSPELALQNAQYSGFTMASELRRCGLDISFAPVLDLDRGISRVLRGGRAISLDIKTVIHVARAYIKGMHLAGMPSVGKHFPGHGAVSMDSHLGVPRDNRTLSHIMAEDMQPFSELLTQDLDAIMVAHIIFPEVSDLPASLSEYWLKKILRQQLHFSGIIFSDCLSMAGVTEIRQSPVERVRLALEAGCDMALLCNDRLAQLEVLAKLNIKPNDQFSKRLEDLRQYQGIAQ